MGASATRRPSARCCTSSSRADTIPRKELRDTRMPTGFTLWFTGLSGSGKSTLAHAVADALARAGRAVDLLDGDVVRQELSKGLGFGKDDRETNIRRIGFVASLITKHGGVAITAAISPYRAGREANRTRIGRFVEVYCKCPLAACEARDVKGLYKKARQAAADGKPMQFTGVDDPYEEPLAPEIVVETDKLSIKEGADLILKRLHELGYLDETLEAARDANAHHEQLPEELVEKAAAAFKQAGRVHTQVLMDELHVGFATAARLIDRLSDDGRLTASVRG
ncbi:MAG: adenylyl-sulfate kinase [Planctomycetota bacterium]|nr:adenylyl-sulfate kinase [Planctomycetota bacterium]